VLYTNGVQEQGALCDESGLITTTAGNDYQLADFSSNNALVLKNTFNPGSLVFEEPITTSELYLLAICADGSGGLSLSTAITHVEMLVVSIFTTGMEQVKELLNTD